VRVIFLGYLKDTAGKAEIEIIPETRPESVDDLIASVAGDNTCLSGALSHPSIHVIINKSIPAGDELPDRIDEVAFMPPLSGG